MRQACGIETHGLAYRQKFLQSYRKAVMEAIRSSIRRSLLLAVAPTGFPAPVVPPGLGSKNHSKNRPTVRAVRDATILRRAVEHALLVGDQASRGLGAVAAIRST